MKRLFLVIVLSVSVLAQTLMRNEDVVRMVVEKSQESAILDAIAGSRPGFLLTPAGIQHLQLNGGIRRTHTGNGSSGKRKAAQPDCCGA